ncbi:creatininase family protein [Dactylosporangium sp. CA-139066]|uniref:creatininase family protein n=1 Tax=Dactylosporangium sp. CA-139066 TaxID=3239930 RepID=UPI003D8B19DD
MLELTSMTWPDVRAALPSVKLAIVPIGSTEQHGPHLSLETDAAVANGLAHRLATELGDQALLCPLMPYGLSEHHFAFPGSLTLRPATLIALLKDIAESLVHWGVPRILVVNGHGGNTDAVRLAAREVRRDTGALMAHMMWSDVARDEAGKHVGDLGWGHACEAETSVVMVVNPDGLRADRVPGPAPAPALEPLAGPPFTGVDVPIRLDEWSPNGALGDPRLATPAAGEKIVEVTLARALDFAHRLIGYPLNPVTPLR